MTSGRSACVAGRCLSSEPTLTASVDLARRFVVRPVDLGYVRKGLDRSDSLPAVFALGRDSARLMLRFAVSLVPNAKVVEAYVVLHRSTAADDDPSPISIHATRIDGPWQRGSTPWVSSPRLIDIRSPATVVEPSGAATVRINVLEFVREWARQGARSQGLAVVAENESRTGMTFAFRAVDAGRTPAVPAVEVEPYLELYVR